MLKEKISVELQLCGISVENMKEY